MANKPDCSACDKKFDYGTSECRSCYARVRWADPKHRECQKRTWTPERREQQSQLTEGRWQDPGHREQQSKSRKDSWTPKRREQRAEISKELWQNPEYRDRQLELLKQNSQDPEVQARHAEGIRNAWTPERREQQAERMQQRAHELWADPDYQAMHSRLSREQWNGPDYRERVSTGIRERQGSPENRQAQSERSKEMWANPDCRVVHSRITRDLWNDPGFRERVSQGIHIAKSSPEQRQAQSERMKELWTDPDFYKLFTGENCHWWRGGISFEPYTPEFNHRLKESIRDRDQRTCQLCGLPESDNIRALDIHHIDYDKTNNNPGNLIALCAPCHTKTGSGRETWQRTFTMFMLDRSDTISSPVPQQLRLPQF